MILPLTTRAQQPTRSLLLRRSARKLTEEQLSSFRRAISEAMGIQDDRGYNHHAGIHGLPLGKGQSQMYCIHDDLLWLPWHRAYLYLFELALRDQVSDASLPWWDWTSPSSHASGLPEMYTEERLDGGQLNPLRYAPIPEAAQEDARRFGSADVPTETFRDPQPADRLPDTDWAVRVERLPTIEQTLNLTEFRDFSKALRRIHNYVHVWVGGTVADVPFAAYDPIFWAHHAMIDRVWRLWQLRHPGASLDFETLGQALEPFPLTVAEVLDVAKLGYEYASFSASVPGGGS